MPNITSVSSLFSHAGGITAYSNEEQPNLYITIPRTFFDYTPNLTSLSSMFSHTTMYANPDYAFVKLRNNALNVSSIFNGVT